MNKRVRCPACHKTKDGLILRKYWRTPTNLQHQYARVLIKTHKVGMKRCKGSQRKITVLIRVFDPE